MLCVNCQWSIFCKKTIFENLVVIGFQSSGDDLQNNCIVTISVALECVTVECHQETPTAIRAEHSSLLPFEI